MYTNLGHVYLQQGHKVHAIRMYENMLRRSDRTDTDTMLFLANAYYEAQRFGVYCGFVSWPFMLLCNITL